VKPIIRPNQLPCRWARVGRGHLLGPHNSIPTPFPQKEIKKKNLIPHSRLPFSLHLAAAAAAVAVAVAAAVAVAVAGGQFICRSLHTFSTSTGFPSFYCSDMPLRAHPCDSPASAIHDMSSAAPVPVPPLPQATIPRLQRALQSPIAFALPLCGREAGREVLGPLVAAEPRAQLLAPLPDRAPPCLIARP
jgi:hypothetical protein